MDTRFSSDPLSPLDRAILTEKQKNTSVLEVALRLLLEEETVRRRLRSIRIAVARGAAVAAPGPPAHAAPSRLASVA